MHFSTCTEYKKSFRKFQKDQRQKNATKTPVTNPVLKKQKFDFFKRQFTTLKKYFRSYFERRDAEAYFIRTLRPDLNGQNEHKVFKLFWLRAILFCEFARMRSFFNIQLLELAGLVSFLNHKKSLFLSRWKSWK